MSRLSRALYVRLVAFWCQRVQIDIMISLLSEVGVMTSILIRGLSDEAIDRVDAEAAALGLSRNEYLRRQLEGDVPQRTVKVTQEDWTRSAEILADLADPDVMAQAWQ